MMSQWLLPVEIVAIPARPEGAPAGSAFAEQIRDLSTEDRHAAGVQQLLAGNIPDRLRLWWPVVLDSPGHTVVVWVSPRYLSVGTDTDEMLLPMDLVSAAQVALAWECALPTRLIVDAIFEQATHRTEPVPLPPGPEMESVEYARLAQSSIEVQLGAAVREPGLFAGQKKDLVLTPQLHNRPQREAIYGWHRPDRTPIQPLSLWHRSSYSDYSHGLRLVYGEVLVDGVSMPLWTALADPVLAPLLSDEGPIEDVPGLLRAVLEAEQARKDAGERQGEGQQ
jgi:hypothetical protein